MKPILASGLVALALFGCANGFNPLNPVATQTTDPNLLPGTGDPQPNRSIIRYEAQDGSGNGYAQSIAYDPATDTFTVDNLAFDGGNTYARDDVVAGLDAAGPNPLGPFQVYEGDAIYFDDVTGAPIPQFEHKAIYGESTSGNTNFAIVRTGAYVNYGFGGFVYARDGGVTLPTTGQATYTGSYAGLRDFDNQTGLEYVTGDMRIDIDFEDFNIGNGVNGEVTNRQIFDVDGNNLTADVTTALGIAALPVLYFTVGPGVMTTDGEIAGEVTSSVVNTSGALELFEEGNYYAVIAGDNEEIVGVIVVEALDPRFDGVTVRETGGFILYN